MSEIKIQSAVVWGDSIAHGVIYDDERKRYCLAPESAASLIAKKLHIELRNRSRMGLTSDDGLRILKKDLENGVRADAAILEFGGNDCNFNWKEISEHPDDVHLPKVSAEQYASNMEQMVLAVKDAGMIPVVVNLTPVNAEKYFSFISGGLSPANILHWLGDKFQIYRYQERYSILVSNLARKLGCKLLDIRSAFLGVWDCTTRLFCTDGIHPTADGQKLIGKAILASL